VAVVERSCSAEHTPFHVRDLPLRTGCCCRGMQWAVDTRSQPHNRQPHTQADLLFNLPAGYPAGLVEDQGFNLWHRTGPLGTQLLLMGKLQFEQNARGRGLPCLERVSSGCRGFASSKANIVSCWFHLQ
jgi:hypothetical protein